jgi:hypothetical protein
MSPAVRDRAAPHTGGDAPMTRDTTDALLFDLGNVVFDLDFSLAIARWASHAACDEALIRERFRKDDAYRRHGRGEIDDDAYFTGVRAMLGIDISNAQLLDGWNAMYVGEMPDMADLLAGPHRTFRYMRSLTRIARIGSTGQYALPRSSPISGAPAACRRSAVRSRTWRMHWRLSLAERDHRLTASIISRS